MRDWITTICDMIFTLCVVLITYFLIGYLINTADMAKQITEKNQSGVVK